MHACARAWLRTTIRTRTLTTVVVSEQPRNVPTPCNPAPRTDMLCCACVVPRCACCTPQSRWMVTLLGATAEGTAGRPGTRRGYNTKNQKGCRSHKTQSLAMLCSRCAPVVLMLCSCCAHTRDRARQAHNEGQSPPPKRGQVHVGGAWTRATQDRSAVRSGGPPTNKEPCTDGGRPNGDGETGKNLCREP